MKKEYSKLHDRYTELFKTHIDYMERTKSILGTERLDHLQQQGNLGTARPRIAGMALNQLNRFVEFYLGTLRNLTAQVKVKNGHFIMAQVSELLSLWTTYNAYYVLFYF